METALQGIVLRLGGVERLHTAKDSQALRVRELWTLRATDRRF
jgi:hypothetical protein